MSNNSLSLCGTPEPIITFEARPETVTPTLSFRRDYSTSTFQGRPMLYRINPDLGHLCWLQETIQNDSSLLLQDGGAFRGKGFLERLKEFQTCCHRAAVVHDEDNLFDQLRMWDLPTEVSELRAMAELEQERVCAALEDELQELEERAAHVRQVMEDVRKEDLSHRSK
ncbi:unnamed protein product [Auanema sp. JU1783]|nr:unnamed protein product [Auanema sp. JU1783]